MQLVMFYTMESIQLLVNTIRSIEREHFFTVIDHVHCQEWRNFLTKTLSVPNSVTQFDSMQLVMFYTMESIQLLVNTIRSIEREHFFTVIDHVHCQEWCNFLTKTL